LFDDDDDDIVLPVREMASAVVDVGLRNTLAEDDVALLIKPCRKRQSTSFKSKSRAPSTDPTLAGRGTPPLHAPPPSWLAAIRPGPHSSKNLALPLLNMLLERNVYRPPSGVPNTQQALHVADESTDQRDRGRAALLC